MELNSVRIVLLETYKGGFPPLTTVEPVRPVSHVGDTFTIARNESNQLTLACSVREKTKSHSTVGSRLANCELAKSAFDPKCEKTYI